MNQCLGKQMLIFNIMFWCVSAGVLYQLYQQKLVRLIDTKTETFLVTVVHRYEKTYSVHLELENKDTVYYERIYHHPAKIGSKYIITLNREIWLQRSGKKVSIFNEDEIKEKLQ